MAQEKSAAAQEKVTSFKLNAHYAGFIDRLVSSGRYGNASEVVRAALRHLEDNEASHERLVRSLRKVPLDDEPLGDDDARAVSEAVEDLRMGRVTPLLDVLSDLDGGDDDEDDA